LFLPFTYYPLFYFNYHPIPLCISGLHCDKLNGLWLESIFGIGSATQITGEKKKGKEINEKPEKKKSLKGKERLILHCVSYNKTKIKRCICIHSHYFFLISMDVRANLHAPQLISWPLKLTIMKTSSDYHISNYKAWTWDHRKRKPLCLKLLLLGHLLDGSLLFFNHPIACYTVKNLSSYYFVFVVFNIYNFIKKFFLTCQS